MAEHLRPDIKIGDEVDALEFMSYQRKAIRVREFSAAVRAYPELQPRCVLIQLQEAHSWGAGGVENLYWAQPAHLVLIGPQLDYEEEL